MAGVILTDCKIILGGYNLSGFHNSLNLDYGAEMLDDTVFGTSGTRSNKPGLKTVEMVGNVFWDTDQDEVNYNRIGANREVLSLAPEGNAIGDIAYAVRAVNGTYNPLSGEVGALLQSEFNALSANTPLVRGRVLADLTSRAATGDGDAVELGAVDADQRLYSALHVITAPGTSIVVTVESDNDSGFPSPTTRITHTLFNAIGAEWMELAGPVTDTYWRSTWTIVDGPAVIYHVVGIL